METFLMRIVGGVVTGVAARRGDSRRENGGSVYLGRVPERGKIGLAEAFRADRGSLGAGHPLPGGERRPTGEDVERGPG